METTNTTNHNQNTEEKRGRGRPKTGQKTKKEYYLSEKQNRYIDCEHCNIKVSKYFLAKHLQTKKHLKNSGQL
jgi:hypothetical protein